MEAVCPSEIWYYLQDHITLQPRRPTWTSPTGTNNMILRTVSDVILKRKKIVMPMKITAHAAI
jgi:hypothetical protein